MPWGVLAAGVTAAGGIAAGNKSAAAAGEAADAQSAQAGQSRADQLSLNAQMRRDSRPYRDSGYNALAQLNYLMGLGDPNATAKTQDYFDPEAYRQWRIDQMTANINEQYAKNPNKAAKLIAKRTEKLNNMLDDPAAAWSDYNTRYKAAPNKVSGDFWKKREGGPGGYESEGYGFLQQRFNNDLFEKDPGYQFRMDEGARAVDAGAAARNGLLSGAAMKAMQRYGQGFASNEYQNAYGRFNNDQQNLYNRLSGIAGTGQQQMNQTFSQTQYGLNNAAQYGQYGADARAAGTIGANNARQSAYGQIGNTLMDLAAGFGSGAYGSSGGFAKGEPNPYDSRYNDGMRSDY